jgi:hypothetical protein
LAVGVGVASDELLMVVLRYMDVVLLALAAVPALALADASPIGYAIGSAGWILQRIVAETDKRLLRKVTEPRKQLGINLFEAFGRIWLMAGAIIAAGLVGRAAGLTAALVIFGAYSVYFVIRVISGPPQGRGAR